MVNHENYETSKFGSNVDSDSHKIQTVPPTPQIKSSITYENTTKQPSPYQIFNAKFLNAPISMNPNIFSKTIITEIEVDDLHKKLKRYFPKREITKASG